MDSTQAGTEQEPVSALARETRPWGYWYDLERAPGYRIKVLVVEPGKRLSLQLHETRSEDWTVLEGDGRAEVGNREFWITAGDRVQVPRLMVHRLTNRGTRPLVVLEVQRGQCDEADIRRLEDDFGRVEYAKGGVITADQAPKLNGGCCG